MPIVAAVGVTVAMLAATLARFAEAATILGAAAQVRGAEDATAFDVVALNAQLAEQLDAGALASAYALGFGLTREQAIEALDPQRLTG